MGLMRFFAGKSPEEIERSGDGYFSAGEYGPAKIEYEKALFKAEKKGPEKAALAGRLVEKIEKTKEGLAHFHKKTGENLMQTKSYADAGELFHLALELTADNDLKQEINLRLKEIQRLRTEEISARHQLPGDRQEDDAAGIDDEGETGLNPEFVEAKRDDDEYFSVLCSTLPEETQAAYQGYGQTFKEGFVALNRGEFDSAVKKLSVALEENPALDSLIPIELATALVNLGESDRARELIEQFIRDNPTVLKGYQILCDIYWDAEDYTAALKLFQSCPDELAQTPPIQLLLGETLYQAGRYDEALQIFSGCEDRFGENEMISRALAKTYEAMGDIGEARRRYVQIMRGCASCGARTDPFIKRRYAELSYQAGETPSKLIGLYLPLLREDPDNKAEYCQRIIAIYEAMGQDDEAQRYRLMLEGLS